MGRKMFWLILLALAMPFSAALAKGELPRHLFVLGEVTDINSALATFESDEGIEREFSVNKANDNGIENLKVGDRLFLKVDHDNLIADIDRITEKGVLEGKEGHRTVVGRVMKFQDKNRKVVIQLPNGEKRTYPLEDATATRMAMVKKGAPVELEIDKRSDRIRDFQMGR